MYCVNICIDPFRRYHDYKLEFVELSLDVDLANSALRVHIPKGCGPVVPRVCMVELASSVVIMFATVTSVFRLILPHPDTVVKVRGTWSLGVVLFSWVKSMFIF